MPVMSLTDGCLLRIYTAVYPGTWQMEYVLVRNETPRDLLVTCISNCLRGRDQCCAALGEPTNGATIPLLITGIDENTNNLAVLGSYLNRN